MAGSYGCLYISLRRMGFHAILGLYVWCCQGVLHGGVFGQVLRHSTLETDVDARHRRMSAECALDMNVLNLMGANSYDVRRTKQQLAQIWLDAAAEARASQMGASGCPAGETACLNFVAISRQQLSHYSAYHD